MVSIPAETVVVPVATEGDAVATATALRTHLEEGGHVVVVYVVEKAGGAPDKTSVEQREAHAEEIFRVARAHLETGSRTVDTRVLYGTDIADSILDAADDVDADLVVFSPRESSRLARFLTGDTALGLITAAERPVLVLPTSDQNES